LWARAEEQYLLDIIGHDSKKYQNIIPRKWLISQDGGMTVKNSQFLLLSSARVENFKLLLYSICKNVSTLYVYEHWQWDQDRVCQALPLLVSGSNHFLLGEMWSLSSESLGFHVTVYLWLAQWPWKNYTSLSSYIKLT
jgi:hypothetical protein